MTAARISMLVAGMLGASGVAFAALGAHVTDPAGNPDSYRSWQAASLLHLVHAPAVLMLGFLASRFPEARWSWATSLMVAGIVLFSGSIYLAELSGAERAGPLTPVGGSLLILAWVWVSVAAWRSRP